METFGKFMTIILSLIIIPIITGFVFSKLWFWFIVPIVHLSELRIVEAIGIMLLISFVRLKRHKENVDNFWMEFLNGIVFTILMSGLTLFIGWIVSLFL